MNGSRPRSIAAASTNVLKVEPASFRPWTARLNSICLPRTRDSIALIAPVFGSIETSAEAGSPLRSRVVSIAFRASFW